MQRNTRFAKMCSITLAVLLSAQLFVASALPAFAISESQGSEVFPQSDPSTSVHDVFPKAKEDDRQGASSNPDNGDLSRNLEQSPSASKEALPVPGADGPVSPTDASTHLDISMEDLLTKEEIDAAYGRAMLRSAQDYSSRTFADVLLFAEQYLGLPYVWGGKNPSRDGGFDCSGYVNWVYNQVCGLGINSDYTNAASLYYNWCTPISESEARPGDIVFFTGTYGSDLNYISHVGIYCGNGIMINAGDPIGYDPVSSVKNVQGQEAKRLYGRLVTLQNTVLDFTLAKVQIADQPYTGAALTPRPAVIVAGSVLNEGTDYTLSYANNVQVGRAQVTVTGMGIYAGQALTRSFDIFVPGAVTDGVYEIGSRLPSGRVVDVVGGSVASGAGIQLYDANQTEAQLFRIARQQNGYYTIMNSKSGQYLTVSNTGGNLRAGTEIVQRPYQSGAKSQEWVIKANGGGFAIASAADSSLVFDVEGGSDANGAPVRLWDANGTPAQTWCFNRAQDMRDKLDALAKDNAGMIADGTYQMSSGVNGGFALDVYGGSKEDLANVWLFSANGTPAQTWRVSHDEAGYLTIVNEGSGKALDVYGGSGVAGTNVVQYAPNGSWAQKWVAVKQGSGYKLVSALNDSLVLDLYGGNATNQNNIWLHSANGTPAQTWCFNRAQDMRDRLDALAKDNAGMIADGTYQMSSGVNGGFALDVYGGSKEDLANVWLFSANGTPAQTWRVSHDEAGYLTIVNEGSGKALDVYGGSGVAGTNVVQYAPNGSWAQKWVAVKQGSGYKLVSALNDSLVLDLYGGNATNQNNIWLHSANGTPAQTWIFDIPGCQEIVPSGYYTIHAALNPLYQLDMHGASLEDGAKAWLYSGNDTLAQLFQLEWTAGYYTVTNVNSGKKLGVVSSGELQQSSKPESDASRFVIRSNADGSYMLLNRATKRAMTVLAGVAASTGAVGDAVATGSISQKWILKQSATNVHHQSYGITLAKMAALNGVSPETINPNSHAYGTRAYYQFADLRKYQGDITVEQMNRFISSTSSGRSGVFAGKGAAILAAAKSADINEMYLLSHMVTETGWGTSLMAQGKYFEAGTATIKLNGLYFSKEAPAGRYYNFIGWGAYDGRPDTAYDFARYYGWNSIENALNGAAQQLARNYIYSGQSTLYDMRWNPAYSDKYGGIGHQYATDPNWARTISSIMGQGYDYIGVKPRVEFLVPRYAS
ncbi:RICIN domain-containing protein [Paraeggerthella hongkongensis]|uniref:RICIN domain-containing protein n=1 Tax=Paraeggerthella hominis TaxID=2897351 RepID=UPI001C0FB0EF|nr:MULTISPECIES: RICIN domain-containing protein [Paraeggerthella]MBU5406209.1 RICIN domain-containing protein [Paraeggerthella hongkongensis]MCD2434058.1 RICIN domain-containing protein [Paraeggerthella hominis]